MAVKLLGSSSIENENLAANYARWNRWAAIATGDVSEIRIYAGASGNVKVAIYADNAGVPGTRLGKKDISTAIFSGQWNFISLEAPVSVIQGVYYWIAFAIDIGGACRYSSSAGQGYQYLAITYSTWTWPTTPSGQTNAPGFRTSAAGWDSPLVPRLLTNDASNILRYSATIGGIITNKESSNVTRRGIEYGTESEVYTEDVYEDGSFIEGGYNFNLIGLDKGKIYYFRAYATNNEGTGYGLEKTFTTKLGNEITIQVQKDTFLLSNQPTFHYGGGTSFVISRTAPPTFPNHVRRGILGFTGLSQIPSDYYKLEAKLRLWLWYNYLGGAATLWVCRLTRRDLVEGTGWQSVGVANWNDYAPDLTWTSPGGDYTEVDKALAEVESIGWVEWDVSDLVKYAIDNQIDAHFLIRDSIESSGTYQEFWFYSKQAFNLIPELEITYWKLPKFTVKKPANVTPTTAKLRVTLIDGDQDETCEIRWGYGESSCEDFEDYDTIIDWGGEYRTGDNPYLDLSDLEEDHTYYYNAQMRNITGTATGVEQSFITGTLMVDTRFPSEILTKWATLEGEILGIGAELCNYRGFVWGRYSLTNPGNVHPSEAGYEYYWLEEGSFDIGEYEHKAMNLAPDTIYYFRAVAHNEIQGWAYE